jgi:hypothetical protein
MPHRFDRLFCITLRQLWTDWADALVLVKPDAVVSWHRRTMGGQCAPRTARSHHSVDEHHLRRLGRAYLGYHHDGRTHIGLNKGTPTNRAKEQRSIRSTPILSAPRIGGLHHRYSWSEAAYLSVQLRRFESDDRHPMMRRGVGIVGEHCAERQD